MTVQNPPSFIQASSHPAEDVRRTALAWITHKGVLGHVDLAVTERGAGANMSVDVAGGRVAIFGSEATYQGLYVCENRGTTNVSIAAADATNPRKDLIVAKVQDAAYSGVTNAWSIVAVTGTPAASPAEPAVPSNAIVLAMVDVPALDTTIGNAQITDRRFTTTGQFIATGPGGIVRCLSTNRPTSPIWEGLKIYETDTNKEMTYDGTSWWCTGIAGSGGTNYTPTLDQGGSNNVAKTVSYSQYRIVDGICEWWFRLDVTGTSTSAGFPVTLTTPVTMATTVVGLALGGGIIFDTSATTADSGQWEYKTTTSIMLFTSESTNDGWGATPSIAIVSGDQIRGHVRFPVAAAA